MKFKTLIRTSLSFAIMFFIIAAILKITHRGYSESFFVVGIIESLIFVVTYFYSKEINKSKRLNHK